MILLANISKVIQILKLTSIILFESMFKLKANISDIKDHNYRKAYTSYEEHSSDYFSM